jgi:hypothetical protein
VSATLDQDGDWVLLATLTDRAGNTSFTGSSVVYTLDTAAPATPAVHGPSGTGNVRRVTWSWTAEAPSTAECRLLRDAQVYPGWDWAGCRSPQTVSLPEDGGWQWQVRLLDPAGNVSDPVGQSPVYRLDTGAPTAPVVTAPQSPGSDRTPVFVIDGEAGAALECQVLHRGAVYRSWTTCERSLTLDLTGADQGVYAVQARLTDSAGNTSPGRPVAGLPARHAGAGCADRGRDQRRRLAGPPTWTVHRRVRHERRVRADRGEQVLTSWASCTSPWSPELPARAPGPRPCGWSTCRQHRCHRLRPEYRFDRTGPGAPTVTGPVSPGRELAPTWTFTGEPGASAACRLIGPDTTSTWDACSSPVVHDLSVAPRAPTASRSGCATPPATPARRRRRLRAGHGGAGPGHRGGARVTVAGRDGALHRHRARGPADRRVPPGARGRPPRCRPGRPAPPRGRALPYEASLAAPATAPTGSRCGSPTAPGTAAPWRARRTSTTPPRPRPCRWPRR